MSRNITVDSLKSDYSETMNDALLRSVAAYANMHGLTKARLSDMLSVLYNNLIHKPEDIISFNEYHLCGIRPGFGSYEFHQFKDFNKIMSMISNGEPLEGIETMSIKMSVYIFTGLVPEEKGISPRTCCNIAARGGIRTLGELASKSYQEVRNIRGAGHSVMQFFDNMLGFYSLTWSTDIKPEENKKPNSANVVKIEIRDTPNASESTVYYTLANKSGLTYGKYNNMFAALAAMKEPHNVKTPGFDYDRVLMFETTTTCKEIVLR